MKALVSGVLHIGQKLIIQPMCPHQASDTGFEQQTDTYNRRPATTIASSETQTQDFLNVSHSFFTMELILLRYGPFDACILMTFYHTKKFLYYYSDTTKGHGLT